MFFWKGGEYKIETDNLGGGSKRLSDPSYEITWGLVKISPEPAEKGDFDNLIFDLKEALREFGYAGARRQLPNANVKFNF